MWRDKPIELMERNDAMEVWRGRKYAKDLDWADPNVKAGPPEAPRRGTRGEYPSPPPQAVCMLWKIVNQAR